MTPLSTKGKGRGGIRRTGESKRSGGTEGGKKGGAGRRRCGNESNKVLLVGRKVSPKLWRFFPPLPSRLLPFFLDTSGDDNKTARRNKTEGKEGRRGVYARPHDILRDTLTGIL